MKEWRSKLEIKYSPIIALRGTVLELEERIKTVKSKLSAEVMRLKEEKSKIRSEHEASEKTLRLENEKLSNEVAILRERSSTLSDELEKMTSRSQGLERDLEAKVLEFTVVRHEAEETERARAALALLVESLQGSTKDYSSKECSESEDMEGISVASQKSLEDALRKSHADKEILEKHLRAADSKIRNMADQIGYLQQFVRENELLRQYLCVLIANNQILGKQVECLRHSLIFNGSGGHMSRSESTQKDPSLPE